MARIIKGNADGDNGENDSYRIPGRSSNIQRKVLVKEVKRDLHPDFGIYTRNKQEYVRGNPDRLKKNNVDN